MKPSARIQAAVEVLDLIEVQHRPAATALADWGKAHRFAGSGDRSAIGNLVYDTLRHRAMAAYRMNAETPRALVLGALAEARQLDAQAIGALCDGSQHAPPHLSAAEAKALTGTPPRPASDWQTANLPQWLAPRLRNAFGERLLDEGRALARRAPVDLRVNTLKTTRDEVITALARFAPAPMPLVETAVRIAVPEGDGRTPNIEAETAHGRGWFEVQDAGSQVAAALAGVKPGDRVLDLCAGAGGKTLALAAHMKNTGSITAYDSDRSRLRPIFERLLRAGVTIVDVLDAGNQAALDAKRGTFDVVLVDAPCSGSGTWRRKPDAKWRLKSAVLDARIKDQRSVLARASEMVRPGGRIVYVTCSLLPEENTDQVARFLADHAPFKIRSWRQAWRDDIGTDSPQGSGDGRDDTLLLTPAIHGTDGFFIAALEHTA